MTPAENQPLEELLRSWMEMSVCIRGNRILSQFSFNEIFVCRLLLHQREEGGTPFLTASDLCRRTRLLKSQMNHLLNTMEKKGLIERLPGQPDKRTVQVRLQEAAVPLYQQEHGKILELLRAVSAALGEENTRTLSTLIARAVDSVNDYQRRSSLCPSKL